MRDPAENKDLLPGTGAYGKTPENFDASYKATIDGIKLLRDNCRVLSLTHEVDGAAWSFGCCWARPRMWEQYADVHRGVCLVFDTRRFENTLREAFRHRAPFWLGNVRYTEAGIVGSATGYIDDQRIFDNVQRSAAIAEYINRNHGDFFFLKSDDFESEREYRAVLMEGEGEFASVDYEDALVAVIVGERFPWWQIEGARAACDRAGVKLGFTHWSGGRPVVLRVPPRDTEDGPLKRFDE
jgi:hypothetical protein